MRSRKVPDLNSLTWKGFHASDNGKLVTLVELFAFTEHAAIEASDWYLRRRVSPSRKSKALRASAAISAVTGAVLPLIHSAAPSWVNAEWGFVFLALGGGAVLFDRTFGYSASWIRYAKAAFSLQRSLASARIDFTRIYVDIDDCAPSESDIHGLLEVISRLQSNIDRVIEEETSSWTGYLSESLEELTRSTARHGEIYPPQTGGRIDGASSQIRDLTPRDPA